MHIGEEMIIMSTGFPSYNNDQNDVWYITSESGFFVNFTYFDIERYYDLLYMKNGPDNSTVFRKIKLTGLLDFKDIINFSEKVLTIEFISDGIVTAGGFQAVIVAVNATLFNCKYIHFALLLAIQ